MFDYIKLDISHVDTQSLMSHNELEFKGDFMPNTGEAITNKYRAKYKSCTFTIWDSGRKEFQGSLHKLWNDGEHNFNDFGFEELGFVIDDLRDRFGIIPERAVIRNLEFGVNISSCVPTKKMLSGLMYHKGKTFGRVPGIETFLVAKHNRYSLKIYDKFIQYTGMINTKGEILRIEIKVNKMIEVPNFQTLNDLLNPTYQREAIELLIKRWKEVIFFDPTIRHYEEELDLQKWSNPNFWMNCSKGQRFSECKKLGKIVFEHSMGIQAKIANMICEKFNELQDPLTVN